MADFELVSGAEIPPADDSATLRPRGGVPVRIRLRRAAGVASDPADPRAAE